MPVADPLLAEPPAEEDRMVVAQGVEIHQAAVESLEETADRLQLLEVAVDAVGMHRHRVARSENLRRPPGSRPGRAPPPWGARARAPPRRILREQVLDDAPDQRE